MKKKKLTGKLSLQKSKISALNSLKIKGGWHTEVSLCGPATNCFCVTTPKYCNGSQDCGEVTVGTGSECNCL